MIVDPRAELVDLQCAPLVQDRTCALGDAVALAISVDVRPAAPGLGGGVDLQPALPARLRRLPTRSRSRLRGPQTSSHSNTPDPPGWPRALIAESLRGRGPPPTETSHRQPVRSAMSTARRRGGIGRRRTLKKFRLKEHVGSSPAACTNPYPWTPTTSSTSCVRTCMRRAQPIVTAEGEAEWPTHT